MVRPTLSDETFIRAIFYPSKNPLPAGLRRRKVTRTPGRVARRVRMFNSLSTKNQTILDKTGQREAYLRGETTMVQARQRLRNEGIRKGWAKPPRPRVNVVSKIVDHIGVIQFAATGMMPDVDKLRARVERMDRQQRKEAMDISWAELQAKAADRRQLRPPVGGDDEGDEYYPDDDINPYWYND